MHNFLISSIKLGHRSFVFIVCNLFAINAIASSVLDIQPFASRQTIQTVNSAAWVTNLNQHLNTRFLLGKNGQTLNIERPPYIKLEEFNEQGARFSDGYVCDLWGKQWDDAIQIQKQNNAYSPLCDGHLYLIGNPVPRNISAVEWSANFLRDHFGSFGDGVIDSYKNLTRSMNYQRANYRAAQENFKNNPIQGPRHAQTTEDVAVSFEDSHLNVKIKNAPTVKLGSWYLTEYYSGVYVSVVTDAAVTTEESKAKSAMQNSMVYSAAIELSTHSLGWMHGTRYPGVGWSKRYLASGAQPQEPGPNGYNTLSPLAAPGSLPPYFINQTIATFAGGFKREHGAFKMGEFSKTNAGSHYGFIENGVVLSPLIAGLATFYTDSQGNVGLKTWQEEDNTELLPALLYARQNGVPLIEGYDAEKDESIIGELVSDWGRGNWSGQASASSSSPSQLIAPRSSICMARMNNKKFLIYSYFTNHSPEAMAQVLQAYHCEYAIHLDMNSPQHAMFSLFRYHPEIRRFETECLYDKMQCLPLPRFVTADNRDFFWIMER